MIDKVTKKTHSFSLFSLKRVHYEVAMQINLMRFITRELKQTITKRNEKSQYRNVILKINHRYQSIHARRFKAYNAFII